MKLNFITILSNFFLKIIKSIVSNRAKVGAKFSKKELKHMCCNTRHQSRYISITLNKEKKVPENHNLCFFEVANRSNKFISRQLSLCNKFIHLVAGTGNAMTTTTGNAAMLRIQSKWNWRGDLRLLRYGCKQQLLNSNIV